MNLTYLCKKSFDFSHLMNYTMKKNEKCEQKLILN